MAATLTPSTPALDKAITILETLGHSKAGYCLPDLVRHTGMPKSTVHCLLITLERRGYLYRNERTGRYVLGLKLFNLANLALTGIRIREVAEPYLRQLMDATRMTVHMCILEQGQTVLVAKLDPPGEYQLATWIGKQMEIHCTAVGKAMAAYLPPAELERIFRECGFPRHNDNTISSLRRLRDELKRTAERGYAIDDEEDEIGFRCIGAPIFDADRRVTAAISVAGTTEQLNEGNLKQVAQKVCFTTSAITGRMLMEPSAR